MPTKSNSEDSDYRSYLLRLWRADAAAPWRVMIEEVRTGQRRRFASLTQLLDFLENGPRTGLKNGPQTGGPRTGLENGPKNNDS